MARKFDLNTIAKEYAEGRLSKEDFLYLHKMLSSQQPRSEQQSPPILKNSAQRQSQQQSQRQSQQPQSQRRTVRPVARNPDFQQPPVLHAENYASAHQPFPTHEQRGGFIKYIRTHHKEAVALLGTLGIFISMFYNKIDFNPPSDNTSRVVMVKGTNEQHSPRIRTQDVKLIAQLMMEDNSWNSELIDDFKTQWIKLSDSEKSQIKQSDWYFDFSSMLSKQIKTSRTKAKTGDVASIYNQQALLGLADALIFGNSEDAEKLIAKMSRQNSPASKKSTKSSTPKSIRQDVDANKEPKRKSETVAKIQSREQFTNSAEPLKRHRISRSEIEDIIHRFTVAFEAGHSKELAALFADDDYSSSFTSLNKVKSEYRKLFRNTRDRQLDFNSFFWEHDFDEARGSAKYNARVRMLDANINKTISADVDITLRRLMGKIYITNFKIKDKKVVSSSPKFIKKFTKDISSKDRPKFPTPAELQDLVTQYVTAYETGDVKELMKLFANATWTKSRTGLVEMKQNYQDLFSSTSDREVFIKDVKWEIKGDKALGTGDLLLTLHTGDNKVETKKGKIRIVARKSKDLVRFTQMFHIYN